MPASDPSPASPRHPSAAAPAAAQKSSRPASRAARREQRRDFASCGMARTLSMNSAGDSGRLRRQQVRQPAERRIARYDGFGLHQPHDGIGRVARPGCRSEPRLDGRHPLRQHHGIRQSQHQRIRLPDALTPDSRNSSARLSGALARMAFTTDIGEKADRRFRHGEARPRLGDAGSRNGRQCRYRPPSPPHASARSAGLGEVAMRAFMAYSAAK